MAHALLSASAASRWLHCPPSARLTQTMVDTSGIAAQEGTLAHEIAELKARKKFTEPMGTRTFNARMKKLQTDELYDEEMQGYTDVYIDFLAEKTMEFQEKPYLALEVTVDYSDIAPEGFGTADCVIIGGGIIQVIDFKYGKSPNGRVTAENNPQMMLYALGVLQSYRLIYGDTIHTAKMAIVQPRLAGGVTQWECSMEELTAWGKEYVAPLAELAHRGEGEFSSGDWCKYCLAKGQCRAFAQEMLAVGEHKKALPPLLSDTEVGEILQEAKGYVSWLTALETYALSACLAGKEITGWKAVEGTSRRQWGDTDSAFKALIDSGVKEEILYERKPLTAPAVEKLLGKKTFGEIAQSLVVKPRGKPALVLDSDKRPIYNAAELAFGEQTQ